jgi:hypothetical protein
VIKHDIKKKFFNNLYMHQEIFRKYCNVRCHKNWRQNIMEDMASAIGKVQKLKSAKSGRSNGLRETTKIHDK